MVSTSYAEANSAISPDMRTHLDQLADLLLERSSITAPFVPVHLMLKQPLDQLWDTPYDQISFSSGYGIGEKFQVPSQAAIVRLAELGLPIPVDVVIDPDE